MRNLLFFLSLLLSSCFAAGQDTTFIAKSKTFEDGSFVVERYSARISFQADSLGVLDDSDDNILSIIKKDFIDIDEAASKYQHYYLFCGNNSIRVVASNYIMSPKHLYKLLGFTIIDGRVAMVFNEWWEDAAQDASNALILNTFIRTGTKRLFSYREQGTVYSDGESSFFFPHFPEDDEPSITLFQITSSPYSKWRVQIEPF